MLRVYYRDMGWDILPTKQQVIPHKWALSTETMDEEVWYGSSPQDAWKNRCEDKQIPLIEAEFVDFNKLQEEMFKKSRGR